MSVEITEENKHKVRLFLATMSGLFGTKFGANVDVVDVCAEIESNARKTLSAIDGFKKNLDNINQNK